jgi:2,4-dienoyl-CoA reductase-like NADH-dependent reductase (Old Yellow Enzyme family)
MQAAGLDGIEIEAYGHLPDAFWSPATNRRDDEYGGSLDNRMRFSLAVLRAIRAAVGEKFIVGVRMVADEDWERGLSREEGIEIARRFRASGLVDFLNIIRGHIETDNALAEVIPIAGMRSAPHLDFAGEVRAATSFPVFHAARISDVATARHAIASGKLDMVGMTRALTRTSRARCATARSTGFAPASAPRIASTASMKATTRCASTTRRPAARRPCRT